MRKLLICSFCKAKGIKNILGEVIDDKLVVKRYAQSYTVIEGSFSIKCNCGEMVYFKIC